VLIQSRTSHRSFTINLLSRVYRPLLRQPLFRQSQSRPPVRLGRFMILGRQGKSERFRCVGITLAEIYETQRSDAIVPYMTSGVVRKSIHHNFETLHAKLRYTMPDSLYSNLCHLHGRLIMLYYLQTSTWTWKTENHTYMVGPKFVVTAVLEFT